MGRGLQSDLDNQDEQRALRERVEQLEHENARLGDSEERLQILFEHAPDGYYLSDLKGTLMDGNAAAERITGYKKGELIGKSLLKLRLLSAGDVLRAASLLARNVLGQSTGPDEFTLTRKDGAAITVEISTRPVRIGKRRLVLGIARDITERKRAEHQLRERTRELQALYSLAEIAERDDISLDELYQELTDILPKGWQYEDIACARIVVGGREFRTGNFAESRWKQSAPVKVAGVVIGAIDVSYLDERPDEDEGPFLKEERRLIDALAERLGRITERKRSEGELRLSAVRLEEAQRTARVGSWETNLVTAQVAWSDELCRLFEIAPEVIREGRDQVQAALVERIHPDDRARYEEAIAQSVHQNARYDIEYRIRWSDGSQRYLHSRGGPTLDPGGNLVRLSGTVTDITERKQVETYRDMGSEVLQILNEPGPLRGSIERVLAAVKVRTGLDAVGMRLQDGDDFPYYVQEGFSESFLLTENTLIERSANGGVCRDRNGNVSLECTCGLVISGKIDPSNPLFTQGGSSWTNDSFPFLEVPPDQDPRHNPRNQCIHQGYASVALVPIRTKDKIVGLFQLNDRRKGCFSLAAIEQLEGIAAHVGEALMRKQLEEQLARMARHDPLTGVLNRYALEELLEREASRSERYTHPIGFLMIDVNRFKEINDRFGHAMGDKVLQAIAAVIQHNIRDADILVRYGGDEFLVILPETNGETDVVRDRILAEVAARNRTNPLLDFPVTLAIGSAHWSSGSGQTMEQILAETDKLMYEDKRRSSGTA